MRKIVIFLLFILTSVSISFPEIQVGVISGISWMSDSKYKGGFTYGGILEVGIMKYLSLEGYFSFQNFGVSPDQNSLSKGEAKTTRFLLAVKGRYPVLNNKLYPFVSIGFGYALNKFELDSNILNEWANIGFNVKEEIKNLSILNISFGADYFVLSHLSIGAKFIYSSSSPDGSWSQSDIYSNENVGGNFSKLNFNSIGLLLSLRYVF